MIKKKKLLWIAGNDSREARDAAETFVELGMTEKLHDPK
jgi:hypothetical protein